MAATIRYNWVAEAPTDYIYLHRLQNPAPTPRTTLLVHTLDDAAAMAAPMREIVRAIDPGMPMFGVRTMADFYRARALTASNVIVGIVGSSIGFWLAAVLGFAAYGPIAQWAVSIAGAALLILLLQKLGIFR